MLDSYKQSGMFLALDEGTIEPSEFYDYIRRESGRDTSDEAIRDTFCRFLVEIPRYKLEMLRALRERFGVYLLSNTNGVMMPYIRDRFFTTEGLTADDYFDRMFLSYEMKLHKPGEEIFLTMLREGGFEASETLFIDDSQANIATAERLGFATYLARPREDYRAIFASL